MSPIVATVTTIDNLEQLNIVEFDFQGLKLKMMSLDLNANVQVGKRVVLSIKPTNIALAKNITGDLSFSNQIVATIDSLIMGELLSSVVLKTKEILFESIITVSSAKRMNLQQNDEVIMLIKASDVSISEVLHD
ncbi:MAG: TOBE domain-containing protein [Arcobacteraceae bacterium]